MQEIGDYVRSRITDGAPAPTAAPASAAAPDHGDRLRNLKGMLDDGLISAEEYEAKRQEILADLGAISAITSRGYVRVPAVRHSVRHARHTLAGLRGS